MSAGTCTITANQAGNENYNAATQVSANIVVSNTPKTDQTISFSPALTGTVGQTTNLSATASSGLTAITFASSPATVCTISGNTVSFVSAGDCNITANQAGDDKFNAAKEVSATIVVSSAQLVKKDQVLTFTLEPTSIAGQTATLSATVDSGLTPISFSSYPVEICEVTGSNIAYKAEGECTVVAKQAGNEQFNPVEKSASVSVVSKGVFSLNITDANNVPIPQAVEGDKLNIGLVFEAKTTDVGKVGKFYLTATAGSTALMLTDKGFVNATNPLQAVTSIPLPVDRITLPLYSGVLPAGKYSIYAKYETADSTEEETINFTVKGKQIVTFTNLPTSPKVGEKVNLTLTGGASNNFIELSSTTADICKVDYKTNTVEFIAEGTCNIQATQAGNKSLASGSATGSMSVKSAGVFSLSVTDKDGKATTQATDQDTLNIGLTFKAPTDDVGKTATFYLTANTGSTNLMFTNGKWETQANFDINLLKMVEVKPLQEAASITLPKETIALPLYSGTLPTGKYTVYVKYQIGDKTVKATSVLNIVSKIYMNAYAIAKAVGKSDAFATRYATAYAIAKAAGKSENYATTFAIIYAREAKTAYPLEVIAKFHAEDYASTYEFYYTSAYAKAIAAGKLEFYAKGYASIYAIFVTNAPFATDEIIITADAQASAFAIDANTIADSKSGVSVFWWKRIMGEY